MHVFVSHAPPDRDAAIRLRADLAQMGRQVALDRGEPAGSEWWTGVLSRVQRCAVFVLVVSPDSVRSRGCLAELRYARTLRRPILLVLARPTPLPPDLADAPVFDPARAGADRVARLRAALVALPEAPPLPDRLPADPPVPYLDTYRDRLDQPALDQMSQREILRDLRLRLRDDHDRPTAWGLLVRLRSRVDVAPPVAADLEKVLAPGWQPDPERRMERRYWDGQTWTTLVRHEGREFNERRVPPPEATWPNEPAAPPRPAQPARSSRVPWLLIGGGVAVAAAVAAGAFFLFGDQATDPVNTARTFVDAVNLRDVGALGQVTCDRDRDRAGELFLGGGFRLTLESVDQSGDSPTFTVLATDGSTGGSDRRTFPLIRESGQWRVCTT